MTPPHGLFNVATHVADVIGRGLVLAMVADRFNAVFADVDRVVALDQEERILADLVTTIAPDASMTA